MVVVWRTSCSTSFCKSNPGELLTFIYKLFMGGITGVYSHAVDISPLRYQPARKIEGFLPISLFIDYNILDNLIIT